EKSSPVTAGAGSPVMLIVPSMLPVGPEYAGSFFGLTASSTLADGIGIPRAGADGGGAATAASFTSAVSFGCSLLQAALTIVAIASIARAHRFALDRSLLRRSMSRKTRLSRREDGRFHREIERARRHEAEREDEHRAQEERRRHVPRAHRHRDGRPRRRLA